MIYYKDNFSFTDKEVHKKRGKRAVPVSDTIYTFDIETTSLFDIEGEYKTFDYSLPPSYYAGREKIGTPYIWMFGVNDTVYYGREFTHFEFILKMLSDSIIRKIIWVQNLSFEFGFLPEILKHYTVDSMISRDLRKPISFVIKELNIEFRCSYMLTNLSLEKAAEQYTDVKKLTGSLDYNKARGITTPISSEELAYCKYDIICLYKIIDYYKSKYQHLCNIPYTCTGEARKALNDVVDYGYHITQWKLVPEYAQYLQLYAVFMGGYTHSNIINTGKVFKASDGYNLDSQDIASSYPASLLLNKYPATPFKLYTYDRYLELKDTHVFYFLVTLKNVKSRYYNHYISDSKAFNKSKTVVDNGRIASADTLDLWCTDVDLEIIQTNYECDIIYQKIYGSYAKYLDKRVLHFLLDLYKGKTTLKNKDPEMYRLKKAILNSCYGMACTNPLKNNSFYSSEDGWYKKDFSEEFVKGILADQKKSYSNLFFYAVGCYCTAYSRKAVYLNILKIDKDMIYCDTDSIKYKGYHDDIFEEHNKSVYQKYLDLIAYDPTITLDDLMPEDDKGVIHPIGYFEKETNTDDTKYQEFITLGAKKYAYRDASGLHITVSGVNKKSGVKALHDDIYNFKKGLVFNYNEANKLTHYYMEEQPEINFIDYLGNKQYSTQKYGIVLQPTTYTLGITDIYETLIKYFTIREDLRS